MYFSNTLKWKKAYLPDSFVKSIEMKYGKAGKRQLNNLLFTISLATLKWKLKIGEPYPPQENFVCRVRRANGMPAILKIGSPGNYNTNEIEALRIYAGNGACLLLEADPGHGMVLLEHLQPGTTLAELQDDDQAMGIALDVLVQLQHPLPSPSGFFPLKSWFSPLSDLRNRFEGGTGLFTAKSVEKVESLFQGLFADTQPEFLLHGEFHHGHILSSERGWLTIDPIGLSGPADYEIAPLLVNLFRCPPLDNTAIITQTKRRLSIISERMNFDVQRMLAWATCYAFLVSCRNTLSDGSGWETPRAWFEIISSMQD